MPNTLVSWSLCLLAVLVVAIGAVWVLRQRRLNAAPARPGSGTKAFDGMTTREFDALVGQAFRSQGYQLVGTGADGHSDLVLRRDRQTYLVLCKHWQVPRVGIEVVHALQRSMSARGASGGFALTTGRFSREAVAFASGVNIKLIDGAALTTLISRAKAGSTPDNGPDTLPAR